MILIFVCVDLLHMHVLSSFISIKAFRLNSIWYDINIAIHASSWLFSLDVFVYPSFLSSLYNFTLNVNLRNSVYVASFSLL